MNHEQHKWWSANLGRDMELRVYGHAGKPVMVFPCQEGRYFEYEDFGMVEALRPWINPVIYRG
jgi:esterase/lipase superfamily enzyme